MKYIYLVCIIIGAGLLAFFYLFNFNNMSETVLLRVIPLWFFPLVFGLYGFSAEKLNKMELSEPGSERAVLIARILGRTLGLFGLLLFLPFFFIKSKNALLTALVGTLFWTVLLVVFIFGVFPSL